MTVDATTCGAVGDDLTDNTSAIAAAVSAAIVDGSREVFFPAGVYRHTGIVAPAGVTFTGGNWVASILRNMHPANASMSLRGAGGKWLVGPQLRNLTLDAVAVNAGQVGLDVCLSAPFTLDEVKITGHGIGVKHEISWNCLYRDVQIDRCTTGLYATGLAGSCPVTLVNTRVYNCATGVLVDQNALTAAAWAGGCVTNNGVGTILDGNSTAINFNGVSFENNPGDDVRIGGEVNGPTAISFNGCNFHTYADAPRSVWLRRSGEVTFSGCRWRADDGGKYALAIQQDSPSGSLMVVNPSTFNVAAFLRCRGTNYAKAPMISSLGWVGATRWGTGVTP